MCGRAPLPGLLALMSLGCVLPDLSLDGRPCPCTDGFVCDEATNTCVSTPASGGGGDGSGAGPTTGGGDVGGGGNGTGAATLTVDKLRTRHATSSPKKAETNVDFRCRKVIAILNGERERQRRIRGNARSRSWICP